MLFFLSFLPALGVIFLLLGPLIVFKLYCRHRTTDTSSKHQSNSICKPLEIGETWNYPRRTSRFGFRRRTNQQKEKLKNKTVQKFVCKDPWLLRNRFSSFIWYFPTKRYKIHMQNRIIFLLTWTNHIFRAATNITTTTDNNITITINVRHFREKP